VILVKAIQFATPINAVIQLAQLRERHGYVFEVPADGAAEETLAAVRSVVASDR